MAIRVIEGVPGSGKTYYALHHLLTNYFRWDDKLDWWVPKNKDTVLLTNIDGLKLGASLPEAIGKVGGEKKFFNYARMREWLGDRRCIIVIDEAQNLFDRRFYDKDVFYFFQMHRHLGVDIYLITQDVETLAKELRALSEYRVQAARRVLSLVGEFRYRFLAGDGFKAEAFKTKILKKEQRVFAVYRSMTGEEQEKIGSAPRRLLIYVALMLLCAGGVLYWFVGNMFSERINPGGSKIARRSESPVASSPLAVGKGNGRSTLVAQRSESVSRGNAQSVPVVVSSAASGSPSSVPVARSVSRWSVIGVRRLDGVMEIDGETTFFVTGGSPPYSLSRDEMIYGCRCQPDGLRLGQPIAWYTHEETDPESRPAREALAAVWRAGGVQSPGGRESFTPEPFPNSERSEATYGIASGPSSSIARTVPGIPAMANN